MLIVEIDFMNPADVDEVVEIERESFLSPWSKGLFLNELKKGKGVYYIVGRIKYKVVGYGGVYIMGKEAHITTIAVAKNFRGHRIGEQLLVALIEIARYYKCKRISLEVRESNRIAINLYEKYHFRPRKVIPAYYSDNGENAIFMELVL